MVVVIKDFSLLAGRQVLTADDWEDLGTSLVTRIVDRTRNRGLDATNTPFVPYSAGYAARKAKEVGAGPVNLTLSGQMLNDLRVVASTPSSCDLGFSTFGSGSSRGTLIQRSRSMGANDKAFYATEGAHGKIRNFLDLSDEDEQFLADAIETLIGERLQADEGVA